MARILRGSKDKYVKLFQKALELYEEQHPGAEASLYRQNSASIRIRIIDDRYARMSRARRHDQVWQFLAEQVPEDALQELSVLLLLPHAELDRSFMNMDFEDPIPSRL